LTKPDLKTLWKRSARGVRRIPGQMNKLEQAYAQELGKLQAAGLVAWFAFDCLKLRLAEKTFYEPDFLVMLADGTLEIAEVKGHWEDDARVKIKVAAALFPFRFRAIRRERGEWVHEIFGGGEQALPPLNDSTGDQAVTHRERGNA
jgi:hypothetical protein